MVPWNDQQKRAFLESQFAAQIAGYRQSFPDATHEILARDGIDTGRLYISRERDRIHILDITIAPWFRNTGIGAQVMQELIEEADRGRLSIEIYVENFNPSRAWFLRLGFRVVSEDGFMLFLRREPMGSDNSTAAAPAGG